AGVWILFDQYRVHLGRLTGNEEGPAPGELLGAILSYFFLALGETIFEDIPERTPEELLERYRPLFDRGRAETEGTYGPGPRTAASPNSVPRASRKSSKKKTTRRLR